MCTTDFIYSILDDVKGSIEDSYAYKDALENRIDPKISSFDFDEEFYDTYEDRRVDDYIDLPVSYRFEKRIVLIVVINHIVDGYAANETFDFDDFDDDDAVDDYYDDYYNDNFSYGSSSIGW